MSASIALLILLQAPAFSGERKTDLSSPSGWTATQDGARLILRGRAARTHVAVLRPLAERASVPEIVSVLNGRQIKTQARSSSEIEWVADGAAVTQMLLDGYVLSVHNRNADKRRASARTIAKWWKAKGARVWDKRLRAKK